MFEVFLTGNKQIFSTSLMHCFYVMSLITFTKYDVSFGKCIFPASVSDHRIFIFTLCQKCIKYNCIFLSVKLFFFIILTVIFTTLLSRYIPIKYISHFTITLLKSQTVFALFPTQVSISTLPQRSLKSFSAYYSNLLIIRKKMLSKLGPVPTYYICDKLCRYLPICAYFKYVNSSLTCLMSASSSRRRTIPS